jgi:hypothetical protein
MTGQRFMYYIPWCITDAANIACGISFNTYVLDRGSKQATWDYIYAVEIMGIEAGYTPLKMIQSWNHTIHLWLKNHV